MADPMVEYLHRRLIKDLSDLGAYTYCEATTGSRYIKFAEPLIGSVRLADHGAKNKYRYRWNLVVGSKTRRYVYDRRTYRHFYNEKDFSRMVDDIREYARRLTRQKVKNSKLAGG